MFRDAKLLQEVYKDCMACKSPIDDEDSASFVSVGDPRMRGLSKPLIVFFLYAGVTMIIRNFFLNVKITVPFLPGR